MEMPASTHYKLVDSTTSTIIEEGSKSAMVRRVRALNKVHKGRYFCGLSMSNKIGDIWPKRANIPRLSFAENREVRKFSPTTTIQPLPEAQSPEESLLKR